jgi:putative tricarboxylic transport membrane protein
VPGLIGLCLIACGCVISAWAILSLRGARTEPVPADGKSQSNRRKLFVAVAMLFAGALLLEPLGFMLSTFLFLSIGFVVMGSASWRGALPAAALASICLWLFFTKLLGVGLPFGRIVEILLY